MNTLYAHWIQNLQVDEIPHTYVVTYIKAETRKHVLVSYEHAFAKRKENIQINSKYLILKTDIVQPKEFHNAHTQMFAKLSTNVRNALWKFECWVIMEKTSVLPTCWWSMSNPKCHVKHFLFHFAEKLGQSIYQRWHILIAFTVYKN